MPERKGNSVDLSRESSTRTPKALLIGFNRSILIAGNNTDPGGGGLGSSGEWEIDMRSQFHISSGISLLPPTTHPPHTHVWKGPSYSPSRVRWLPKSP